MGFYHQIPSTAVTISTASSFSFYSLHLEVPFRSYGMDYCNIFMAFVLVNCIFLMLWFVVVILVSLICKTNKKRKEEERERERERVHLDLERSQ
jgi:large-conductance mechanosensitive channel